MLAMALLLVGSMLGPTPHGRDASAFGGRLAITLPGAWPLAAGPGWTIGPAELVTHTMYLALVWKSEPGCQPIDEVYASLDVEGPPTDRPAEEHPDFNLAWRGYEVCGAYRGLVDYGQVGDPRAPQLRSLFADGRIPIFATVYQVYDWDWECDCRGGLLTQWDVTLAGFGTEPGETIQVPASGYDIGDGYEVLVLYASPERITLKYTREDSVVAGYTLHVENVCVEPSLLALYEACNAAGRVVLPALKAGQRFGRSRGVELGVAIRDTGTFMDPRSRGDWWQDR